MELGHVPLRQERADEQRPPRVPQWGDHGQVLGKMSTNFLFAPDFDRIFCHDVEQSASPQPVRGANPATGANEY